MTKLLSIFLFTIWVPVAAIAEIGVTDSAIKLGMSNALSGPASALGSGVKLGVEVYINKVNAAGGVAGRRIDLQSYDDGYEPDRTAANTTKLITVDQVFGLIGYVGTPTSKVAVPILSRSKVPFVGPFTGAEFLRKPINKYVYNVRGSYFDEVETQIEYLVKKKGIKSIGIFIQNDAYGHAVKKGVVRSLRARKMKIAAEGKYTRNTVDVDAGLAAIKSSAPEAIIMVGTYKACASFVKKAKASGYSPLFLNVSFVGTKPLIAELGSDGEGVLITQVTPSPDDASIEIVKQYQNDMTAAGHSTYDYTSLEGYIDAMIFVEGLKATGNNLTRENFVSAMSKLRMSVGDLRLAYSPTNHQALSEIYLTIIKNGHAVSVN